MSRCGDKIVETIFTEHEFVIANLNEIISL